MPFQVIQNHAGKLRHMTGGKASIPVVFVIELTGQTPGFAGQHSDYELDRLRPHPGRAHGGALDTL
jgi:pyruvate/2-oxoglutarate/acetoin dehydrogenase E1 component